MIACPTSAQWRDFLADRVDPVVQAEMVEHVELCGPCVDVLNKLTEAGGEDSSRASWTKGAGCAGAVEEGEARGAGGSGALAAGRPRLTELRERLGFHQGGPAGTQQPARPFPELPGYEIEAELARGGMGVVYRAWQVKLGRPVAIKTILAAGPAGPDQLMRFLIEAEILARLRHPNIVEVYEVGEYQGVSYLVMELVEGGTMSRACSGEPVSPWLAAGLVESLARAMHHAHLQGVVHRDLKPDNILMRTPAGLASLAGTVPDHNHLEAAIPKITDFGLAKQLAARQHLTLTGTVLGTPAYMAPEQADADPRKVGPAVDIYALGVILYELLTGFPPFRGETAIRILERARRDLPASPSRHQPKVPADLCAICLKCLEKQATSRYASAGELANDLRRFLDHKPILARPAPIWERGWKWARRRPALAALFVVFQVFLAAVLGVWIWSYVRIGAALKDADLARQRAETALERSDSLALEARRLAQAEAEAKGASQRREAGLTFRKGVELAESGDPAVGVFWMLEALRIAPSEQHAFHRAVRANIASWVSSIAEQRLNLIGGNFQNFRYLGDERSVLRIDPKQDNRVRRVDWRTGAVLADLFAFPPQTILAAVSRDGKWLLPNPLLKERGARVAVWSIDARKPVGYPMSPTREAVFSADGLRLIGRPLLADDTVRVWDWRTGRELAVLSLPTHEFEYRRYLRPLDDGRIVVVAAGVAQVRNDRDLAPIGPLIDTDGGWINCLHPDGRTVLVERGGDKKANKGRLILFDSKSGKQRSDLLLSADLEAGTFSFNNPGDAILGYTHGRGTCVWDATYGRLWYSPIILNPGEDRDYLVSPDGSMLWTADQSVRLPRILSRPCEPPGRVGRGGDNDGRGSVAYSPDRSLVVRSWHAARATQAVSRMARVQTGEPVGAPLQHHGNHVQNHAFSPDGRLIATSEYQGGIYEGTVNVWDAATGARVLGPLWNPDYVASVAFSPDGRSIAAADYQGFVRFWDATTGKPLGQPLAHTEIAWSLAFSPDGRRLAVGTTDDRNHKAHVRLWDLAARRALHEPFVMNGWVGFVKFTPSGDRVIACTRRETAILDFDTGRPTGNIIWCESDVRVVSADGTRVATGGLGGAIREWDTTRGLEVGEPMAHSSAVSALDYSADGRLIVAGYLDGSARVWDRVTHLPWGRPVVQSRPIVGVAFLPDGNAFVSTAVDGSTRVWPVPVPIAGDVDDLRFRVEVRTRRRLAHGLVTPVDTSEWQAQADRLAALGTQPPLPVAIDELTWRDARAHDAEQDHDAFAAVAHLTAALAEIDKERDRSPGRAGRARAVGLRPPTWLFLARRARIHSEAGRLDVAADDYDRAAALATPDDLKRWYCRRIADCETTRQWQLLCFYAGRALAIDPNDPDVRLSSARAFLNLNEPAKCFDDATRAAPGDFLIELASGFAAKQLWHQAAILCRRALDGPPPGASRWTMTAVTLLKGGDLAGFRRFCTRMIDDPQLTTAESHTLNGAEICALGPDAVADGRRQIALIERAINETVKPTPALRHELRSTLGYLLYRAGRYQDAISRIHEGIAADRREDDPQDLAFLALAHHRLGHAAEARRLLGRVSRPLSFPKDAADDLWRAAKLDVLLSEAETVILHDPVFPADPFAR